MLDTTPTGRMTAFLGRLDTALTAGDIDAATAFFAPECYWRDLVAFTWNIKTVEGREQVRDMLTHCLARVKPHDWRVAAGEDASEAGGVAEAWISFETEVARGYGLIRLKDGLIWTLLTTMVELKGHEEKSGFTRPLGALHGSHPGAKTWKEHREDEAATLGFTDQPYTLIIGGGQGGIALGARLRQLGVPTIIIERNERAGDSWRKRYKSLCLHDPVWYDHLPYLDFPKNWPVFSPKDKIGDWLEMYTKVMELNYWTSTTAKSAVWNEAEQNWTVVVERGGQEIVLRPTQLVFATGMSGKANIPAFKGMENFKGEQHHSSRHPGPDAYVGRKVVVIGSNNSALRSRRGCHHDPALHHPHRPLRLTDGNRAGRSLFRTRRAIWHDHGKGRPDLRLAPVPHPPHLPKAGLRQDPRGRCRFLPRSRKSRIPT